MDMRATVEKWSEDIIIGTPDYNLVLSVLNWLSEAYCGTGTEEFETGSTVEVVFVKEREALLNGLSLINAANLTDHLYDIDIIPEHSRGDIVTLLYNLKNVAMKWKDFVEKADPDSDMFSIKVDKI